MSSYKQNVLELYIEVKSPLLNLNSFLRLLINGFLYTTSKSIIKSLTSGSMDMCFGPSFTSTFFRTLINFLGKFCFSLPI